MSNQFVLLCLFLLKHLVIDFFVQNRFPYMWMNKHRIFHPGGWLHAGSHGVGTLLMFWMIDFPFGIGFLLSLFETVTHFSIDCAKMRIGSYFGWKANTSPYFWDLLGLDQFLHHLTYMVMVVLMF